MLRIGKLTTLRVFHLQNTFAKFLFVAFNEAITICAIFSPFFLMVKAKAHTDYYQNTNDDSTCHRPFNGGPS